MFIGQENDVIIDAKLFKPCAYHRKGGGSSGSVSSGTSLGGRSRTDTDSSHSSLHQQDDSTSGN